MKRIFLLVLASCLLLGQSNNANPFQPKITNGTAPNALCASGEAFFNVNTYLWSTCGPTNTWNLIGGSASSAFPSVVAKANYLAQSGSLSFDLLANPVTGDYVLNDYLSIITADSGASIGYAVTYTDESGAISGGLFPFADAYTPTNTGAISQAFGLQWQTGYAFTPPMTIHALTGTPIHVTITVSGATTLQYSYHATLVRNQ